MKKIVCLGDICPIPLMKAQIQAKKIKSLEKFILVTDHSCVVTSIEDYFDSQLFNLHIDEVLNGVWEITIMKK